MRALVHDARPDAMEAEAFEQRQVAHAGQTIC